MPNEPRAIIRLFAAAMEAKMAENDARGKSEWRGENPYVLLEALEIERIELRDAVIAYGYEFDRAGAGALADVEAMQRALLAEAADVALLAMMVADACGALPETSDRGRALVAESGTTQTTKGGA